MKDYRKHLEKLGADAAECALIGDLATNPEKQELFARLAEHLRRLASELEHAISSEHEEAQDSPGSGPLPRCGRG
jgi:hypothetical protein